MTTAFKVGMLVRCVATERQNPTPGYGPYVGRHYTIGPFNDGTRIHLLGVPGKFLPDGFVPAGSPSITQESS